MAFLFRVGLVSGATRLVSKPLRAQRARMYVAGSNTERILSTYMGVSENWGVPYFGVPIIRILLFRVLY